MSEEQKSRLDKPVQGLQIGDNNTQINKYYTTILQSADYKRLKEKVERARRIAARYPGDPIFIKELQQAEQDLENFERETIKLAEEINKIPLNSERGIKVKQFLEQGNYQAAREILDAKEMNREQQALLNRQQQLAQQQEEIATQLNQLAGEFLLKARLTAIDYQLGDQRIPLTRQFLEKALEFGRTPERLFEYALFLQDNNKFNDSEEFYKETLMAYRKPVKNESDIPLSNVAVTLNNLGALIINAKDRSNEAKIFFQEAFEIYDKLANENNSEKSRYLPDVAGSLNNLALVALIHDLPRRAVRISRRAIQIYRELAENNSEEHLSNLAGTLNNLGVQLTRASDQHNEVEKLFQEALTIRRKLVKKRHAKYWPDVAGTLNNLAIHIANYDSSRSSEAEKLYKEALKIYRKLARKTPTIYLPDVAHTLGALGDSYLLWQQSQNALKCLLEAKKIFTPFAQITPEVYGTRLALVQQSLQKILDKK